MSSAVKTFMSRMSAGKWFFLASVCLNVGVYYVLNMIHVVATHGDWFFNDFYNVFMKGVGNFLSNPGGLYDSSEAIWIQRNAYRNLPALLLFHYPFYQLGSAGNLDLITCSLFIMYFNLGSCFLVLKIASHHKIRAITAKNIFSDPHVIASIYMAVSWHYFEYHHAHTQAITAFLVTLGIYFMLEEKEHLTFTCWSAATIFKLPVALWIFFLILRRPVRRCLKNVFFCFLPQVPNIIMFLSWPKLMMDFIPSNVAFSLDNAATFYRVSGTISRELSRLFNMPITGFSIVFFVVFVPITFLILFKTRMHEIDKIMLVALSTITVLPDFWTAHALYVIIPYLVWLSVRSHLHLKWKLACFVPLMFATPWFLFPSVSLFFFLPFVAMISSELRFARIMNTPLHDQAEPRQEPSTNE